MLGRLDTKSETVMVQALLSANIKVAPWLQEEKIDYDSNLIERILLNLDIWNRGICTICCVKDVYDDSILILDKNSLSIIETLVNFVEMESFSLSGLGILSDLDGKKFSDLVPSWRRRIKQASIHLISIEEYGGSLKGEYDIIAKTFS